MLCDKCWEAAVNTILEALALMRETKIYKDDWGKPREGIEPGDEMQSDR